MRFHNGGQHARQIAMRFNAIQFVRLDQGGKDRPVLSHGVVSSEQRVFPVQGDWADCPLDGIGAQFHATIVEKDVQTRLMFSNVAQGLADG